MFSGYFWLCAQGLVLVVFGGPNAGSDTYEVNVLIHLLLPTPSDFIYLFISLFIFWRSYPEMLSAYSWLYAHLSLLEDLGAHRVPRSAT